MHKEPNLQASAPGRARLALEYITVDARLQSRELKPTVVTDYLRALRRGEELPPVRVVRDGNDKYYLVDGYHRVAATRQLSGICDIAVEMIKGTFTDALWLSWGANRNHGLRRTREDKSCAIRAALQHPKWSKQSDRAIGRHIGCFHQTVGAMRRRLASGEYATQTTVQHQGSVPGPSKTAILRACALLAEVPPEQAHQLCPKELKTVRAAYETMRCLLSGAKIFLPKDKNKSEEGINVQSQ